MQLRGMKLGGNAAAGLGLNCKVGACPATLSKYQSRAALDYKARLQAKIRADKIGNAADPFSVVVALAAAEEVFVDASASPAAEKPSEKQTQNSSTFSSAPSFNAPPARKSALGAVKTSKLGAVKSVALDFDQIENVWDDQPQSSFASDPFEQQPSFAVKPAPAIASSPLPSTATITTQPTKPNAAKKPAPMSKEQEAAVGRLGMGMKKLTLQQAKLSESAQAAEAPKSVSSEKFFKQPNAEEDAAVQEKLRNIRGHNSISSSDFFKSAGPEDPEDTDGNDNDDSDAYRSSSGTSSNIICMLIISC